MKSLRERRSHGRKRWLLLPILTLAIVAGVVVLQLMPRASAPHKAVTATQKKAPAATTVQTTSNILVTGNSFWGRYTNDWAMASPLKYKYPFSRLHEFHRENYDGWVSGLECPMAADVHMTSAEMEQALQFNCSPEYLSEAAKWYTVFTLANNHTDNQGADGYKETQQHLDEHGIQYFGHYDPTKLDDVCDVISMPAKIKTSDDKTEKGSLPMAFCGFHGVFQIPPTAAVAVMREYSKYMPVVVMPHMGSEYKPAPDQIKTDFYRSLIDGGADVVLGDHPHWIQSTEAYKGHLIVYSMGNFMFDQQDLLEVTRSAAIQMDLKVAKADNPQLDKWLALAKSCKTYHDSCLQQAEEQKLPKLNVSYTFGVVGTRDNEKNTHLATPEETAAILQRLNWSQTMSRLQPPYTSL